MSEGGSEAPDDLEEIQELRIRGKKADLVELLDTIQDGARVKHHNGVLTPPDAQMLTDVIGQLDDLLEPGAAAEAMQRRLETGDGGPVVGDELDCSLHASTDHSRDGDRYV